MTAKRADATRLRDMLHVETVFATVVKDVPGVREPLVRLLSRIGNSTATID